jgi:hypothetical protein
MFSLCLVYAFFMLPSVRLNSKPGNSYRTPGRSVVNQMASIQSREHSPTDPPGEDGFSPDAPANIPVARRNRVIRKKIPPIPLCNARANNAQSRAVKTGSPDRLSAFTHNSFVFKPHTARKPDGPSTRARPSRNAYPESGARIRTFDQSTATGSGFKSTNVMILIKCLDYCFFENYGILTHRSIASLPAKPFPSLVLNRCERVPSSPARVEVQLVLNCKTAWSRL